MPMASRRVQPEVRKPWAIAVLLPSYGAYASSIGPAAATGDGKFTKADLKVRLYACPLPTAD
jgi:hypothetical protein